MANLEKDLEEKESLDAASTSEGDSVEESLESKAPSTPEDTVTVSTDLLNKLNQTLDKQFETVKELNSKLEALEAAQAEMKQEMEDSKPIKAQAVVKGKYDFSKNQESFRNAAFADEKAYARELYNKLLELHPEN